MCGAPEIVGGDDIDVQDRTHGHLGPSCRFQIDVAGQRPVPQRLSCLGAGKTTEIVERDLRLTEIFQFRSAHLVEITQNSVPDAAVRNSQQFFLDPLENHRCLGAAAQHVRDVDVGEVDSHREDTGEPADGVQDVRTGHHVSLASVTFHRDEHVVGSYALCLPPLRQCQRESSNETVVDGSTEERGKRGQDCVGQFDGHVGDNSADRIERVEPRVQRPGSDQGVVTFEDRTPPGQFDSSIGRDVTERMRPTTNRRARIRRLRLLAGVDPVESGRKFRYEHAPGHAVHREVVDHQEQPAGVAYAGQPDDPHHLAPDGVEFSTCITQGSDDRRVEHCGARLGLDLDYPADVLGCNRSGSPTMSPRSPSSSRRARRMS